ncbi:disintegrin and metalloproteinase domain-containing protein 10 homolog [Dermacentor silvarum]|uniref:disintegrin and metalloproteinase domain-containing protein 10 homolog n=1 Tax=Dermacentor silvarum TaxID=543639 RepID=UPI0021007EA5|nr:disintegrin and metalloproteinase domain-containing protein 10 homolog [Dermacentor silvarum]
MAILRRKEHHPFVSCLVVLGSSWFMLLIFRCFALHTPSNNPLKKPPFKLKDTMRHPIETLVSAKFRVTAGIEEGYAVVIVQEHRHHVNMDVTHYERLNMFVRRFEPVYYDPELVHRNHVRAKRSIEGGGSGHVRVQIRSTKRSLNLHLSADASVFHEDLVVESSTEGIINVDTSHIYKGYIIGQPRSRVFGSLHRGVFEGSIETGSGDSLYVERARRFFNDSRPYHSVLYSSADVEFPTAHLAHGRVGRKLQAITKASYSDEGDRNDTEKIGISQADNGDYERRDNATTKDGERIVGGRRDATEKTEREKFDDSEDERDTLKGTRSKWRRPARRRAGSRSRRVCNLEIVVDNTLTDSVLEETSNLALSREIIASIIAHIVHKVNAIYGDTNFGGIEDINFVVQHIMISEPGDCVGYKTKHDPLCSTSLDPPHLLYLVSVTRHDDYCLSYRLNYRDFSDGTLGLAWIASDELGSGGICERYRTSVELDPASGDYVQVKMSLNTGITTLINHRQYVGLSVGALTLAHEIGHSFGSPVSRTCVTFISVFQHGCRSLMQLSGL